MKKVKLVICLLVAFAMQAFAGDLTQSQEKAQRAVYAYLQKAGYDPSVDRSDNSVCFRRGGVLYWITFTGESPILYTFHRKAYKIGTEDNTYKRKPAIIAANDVNNKHKTVKLSVAEKKVEISIQVYVTNPEEFTNAFKKYFASFENVDVDFKSAYETALKAEREIAERAEEEARKNLPPSELRDLVQNVSFRALDANGNEKSAYDQPLRSFNTRYIQARLEFGPWREAEADYTIQLKVIRPNGTPIYISGKKYSATSDITLAKTRKNQMIEIDQFGSTKEGFWKAGEYKVEIIESGDVIFTTTFNIL